MWNRRRRLPLSVSLATCNNIKLIINLVFKSYVKLWIKLMCLSVLFYSVIEVTKEYFSYPYVYRLSVKPSERLDLPPITVCTERHVFLDKTKINQYFNLTQEYETYKQIAEQNETELIKRCYNDLKGEYTYMLFLCKLLNGYKNYLLNKYFINYKTILLTTYTFSELYDKFTIKSNELIKCTARLYSLDKSNSNNNNSSDSQVMTDCSQSYAVLETIYGNKDFGICFTYFYTNHYNYYLIDDDFIQFDINYETQQKFLLKGYLETNTSKILKYPLKYRNELNLYSDDYFVLHFFVNQMNKPLMTSKETSIQTKRIGLNARLKITTTHLRLISTPYMNECKENGK